MTSREELFVRTEEKIEETTRLLRKHFYDLGIILFKNPSILPSTMGVSLKKASDEAEKALEEARLKKKDDEDFIAQYDEKKERKLEKDGESEKKREEEKELRLRIGALIYEQCSLGLLPREKFSSVYIDSDEEKALNEKALSRSFFKRVKASSALAILRKNLSSRYLDYSSFADNEENAILISGRKAEELISSLQSVMESRKAISSEESELEIYLGENLQRRRALSKSQLEEEEASLEEKQNAFNECIINYGNYLYDRAASWIGESTPSSVLDIVQSILESQRTYSSLNKERALIEKQAKADDYKTLIESEKEKIRILEGEKDKIDLQIAEIQKEIERLEGLVERIFKNQDRL